MATFSFGGTAGGTNTGGFSFGGTGTAGNSAGGGFSFGGSGTGGNAGGGGFSLGGNQANINSFGQTTIAAAGNANMPTVLPGATGGFSLGNAAGAAPGTLNQSQLDSGMNQGGLMDEMTLDQQNMTRKLHRLVAEFGLDQNDPEASRFSAVFFNVEPKDHVLQATNPQRTQFRRLKPRQIRKEEWQAAHKEAERLSETVNLTNAAQETFFPANPAVNGFVGGEGTQGLNTRIRTQDKHAEELTKHVQALNNGVNNLQTSQLDIERNLHIVRENQMMLSQTLLKIMKKVAILMGGNQPLTVAEQQFRANVDALCREMNKPTQFKAKLTELIHLQRMQEQRPVETVGDLAYEEALQVSKVLEKQREGLAFLTQQLSKDLRNVEIIKSRLSGGQ